MHVYVLVYLYTHITVKIMSSEFWEYKTKTWQSIFQGGIALKISLLADITVYNCAWNYIISLNEKIIYI